MKRRKFLTQIPALLGGGWIAAHTAQATAVTAPPSAPAASNVRIELLQSYLSANEYDEGCWIWPMMPVGAALRVVRDPHSRFDPRTVRLFWRGRRVGQLTRADNSTIAHLMDGGHRIEARVDEINPARPWAPINITLWLCL